jgi:hypothetical protein
MELALRKLFSIMPFLFGIGFIAPLIAQTMTYWGLQGPLGLSNLAGAVEDQLVAHNQRPRMLA